MRTARTGFVALALLALGGVSLGHPLPAGARSEDRPYARIAPAELRAAMKTKDFVLVNVHVPYQGEIDGTDLFVPFDRIGASAALPRDKGAEIVVYCRSGAMSAVAAAALARRGYRNVRELAGGFEAWRAAGYRLSVRPR